MSDIRKRRIESRFIIGGVLILVGTALMLQQLQLIYLDSLWSYWPFILVATGIVSIVNAVSAREFGSGLWWIFLGLWLYVSIQHIYGLRFEDTWPALIIAWGVSLIWKSYFTHSYRFIKG